MVEQYADVDGYLRVISIFDEGDVPASGSLTSDPVNLRKFSRHGVFSLQYKITATGAPTIEITYQMSNNGVDFLTPTGASAIVSSIGKATGPGSDGKDIIEFTPKVGKYIKLIATDSAGHASKITIDALFQ